MALALSVRFDAATSAVVAEVWAAFDQHGISSDMVQLGYPAHVSLLVLDDESLAGELSEGLASLAGKVPASVTLGDVRQFPGTSVVWLECLGELTGLHDAAAAMVPSQKIWPHYRKGSWTPHVTLQVDGDVSRAMDFATANWHPGRTAYPTLLELASFPPVVVLESLALNRR
ncbi:2'-5' RNA ligase family protein [Devosia sp.]|uniref:2'-5' RNA ligase family protein n=1 Tax=Devosia sp. TaxID=1871048 RepID=UPI003A8CC63C